MVFGHVKFPLRASSCSVTRDNPFIKGTRRYSFLLLSFLYSLLFYEIVFRLTSLHQMSDKTTENVQMDDLSRLQKRVEDMGVMFYTYLGILQRDAPPTARAPDEKEEMANDEASRKQLANKIPEFAKDIIQCGREIDSLIDHIDGKMKQQEGRERTLLETANFESMQAGDEMEEAVDDAQKLLSSVRDLITARERES